MPHRRPRFPRGREEVPLDPELDLACLSTFLVLAATGSYARTAEVEHLTPSAVAKRVRRLEQQLGVALVLHGGGEPELTAGGRRLAGRAGNLLVHVSDLIAAVRATPPPCTVRVGMPAGPRHLIDLDLHAVARRVRSVHPEVRLVCLPVPYPSLRSAVVSGGVDVLVTGAPVEASGVVSEPLPVTMDRVGLMSPHHVLADAPELSVEDLCAHPMLYNPHVPKEWMSLFYLGDVHPERETRLVATTAREMSKVFDDVVRGVAVTTTLASLVPAAPRRLRAVPVTGAPPVMLWAVRRRTDRRDAVLAFVDAARMRLPAGPARQEIVPVPRAASRQS